MGGMLRGNQGKKPIFLARPSGLFAEAGAQSEKQIEKGKVFWKLTGFLQLGNANNPQ